MLRAFWSPQSYLNTTLFTGSTAHSRAVDAEVTYSSHCELPGVAVPRFSPELTPFRVLVIVNPLRTQNSLTSINIKNHKGFVAIAAPVERIRWATHRHGPESADVTPTEPAVLAQERPVVRAHRCPVSAKLRGNYGTRQRRRGQGR